MSNPSQHSQNFLRDPRLVAALLAKTNIGKDDVVYDIGAGKGIISAVLAGVCRKVVSVEADPALVQKLRANTAQQANVTIVPADFLTLNLPAAPYKVFANIPFDQSAAILHKLTDTARAPSSCYLIAQKEFAQKLTVNSSARVSQLAIKLAVRFETRILSPISAEAFYPRPRVRIVLLDVEQRREPLVAAADQQLFYDFVTYVFNATNPSLQVTLAPLIPSAQLAEQLQITAPTKPSQLPADKWTMLFRLLLQKRRELVRLVGGYEARLAAKHAGHTKLHRTR
ncbi:MAG TPA: rRNA adenine dimethyltransferase family protein [Candidatus Saccharimonadales bacterium]|nr:rRNA adenine dimethyltransferase family protein [Candidatus Saccharimonadales bacterium]